MKSKTFSSLSALLICYSFFIFHAFSQQKPIGIFESQTDVGQVKNAGSAQYDEAQKDYTVSGSGTNMWLDHDEFHLVWKRLKGNFILQTRARFIGQGVEPHRKLGWIVRQSLESNSPHINAAVHGDGLTSLQFRRTAGAKTEEAKSSLKGAEVIQLERKGSTYTMSVAKYGETFVTEQVENLDLGDEVYVGLFVCSHNKDVVEKAVFSDVRITIPARENFVPYREYIGSNLEILDLASGNCKVIYQTPDSLQAPNWTPDNKALIYNRNGKLYRLDLARMTPSLINTDFATHLNNDHALSFDGKWIGISHQSQADGNKSIIYTLPVAGGVPKKITPVGHSYLHGWSPDNKFLIFTGERNGEFDIYKVPAAGGPEVQLTTAKGLDDGSEYTPDGKYIYFNSARTGTMQIWRMRADGSEQEQITDDEYNNWFPHISPDGKQIAFLSFSKEVSPSDHPFYKHVYLRLMRVGEKNARVVAYVYGGQGTINVNSWSPDSRRLAFVSNTDIK